MGVLFLATSLQRNRASYAKNLLLNSNRVGVIKKDAQLPLSRSIMYYAVADGERGTTWELLLSHAMNTLATRMGSEDETNRVIKLNIQKFLIGSGREKATTSADCIWEIGTDQIVYAVDISTTQSHVFVNLGLNVVRLTTSHVVADISRSVSRSQSLSRS